ncbi:FadR/GntR family transcriptional regulator [Spirillospora sp. NPDC048911]|uniref:FadR/GntR family transcriptional regulator n=1 Tax=Spirillospora sp. NPDC048911 TaxID=3364527 RepID=UPI00371CB8D2
MLRRVERASLRDVFEVQLAYDVQAARLAARRRTDADLARLGELLSARAAAVGAAEFGAADSRFHLGVVEATGNVVLIEACRFFLRRLGEALSTLRLDQAVPEASQEAHQAVVDAIARRDVEAAGLAAAAIIEPSLAALETLL